MKFEFLELIRSANLTYRQVDCLDTCYQNALITECKCIDSSVNYFGEILYPNCKLSEFCIMKETTTECLLAFQKRGGSQTECRSECPLECEREIFSFETSFADFRKTYGYIPERDYDFTVDSFSSDTAQPPNSTIYLKSLKLNIYYKDLSSILFFKNE